MFLLLHAPFPWLLQLVQSYRNYVIDSLPQLLCLDGSDVTAKDREVAEGSSKLCEGQKG